MYYFSLNNHSETQWFQEIKFVLMRDLFEAGHKELLLIQLKQTESILSNYFDDRHLIEVGSCK